MAIDTGERLIVEVSEAAALLGVHPETIYRQIRAGAFPAKKIGRRIVIPVEALKSFLSGGLKNG